MICPNCGISVNEAPFMRTNPIGEIGIFWCEPCVQKNEPELYKNEKEDESDVEKVLKEIIYK